MADKSRKDKQGRKLNPGESQRPDGIYVYRWTCNGKRNAIYSGTLAELREKEEKAIHDKLDGINVSGAKVTLNELFFANMKIKKQSGIKDTTYNNYMGMWDANIRDSIGKMKVCDIDHLCIMNFYVKCREKGHKKSTIKLLNILLYSTFQLAVKSDYIRKNPCEETMKNIKDDSTEKQALTQDQVQALIDFCSESATYNIYLPFLRVALGSACRIGELTGLTWSDIDFKNRTIKIDHALIYKNLGDGCRFHISSPKTDAGFRTIPMTDMVYDALVELRKQNMMLGRVSQVEIDGYKGFIFSNSNGSLYAPNSINHILYGMEGAFNKKHPENPIPHLSAHILRHTACTLYAENEMNIKALQSIMGHTDASITMNVYNHADKNKQYVSDEVSRMNQVVNF